MDNLTYEFLVVPRLGASRKFFPGPAIHEEKYIMILVALGKRIASPRLPRLGERVLTRPMEDAQAELAWEVSTWTEHYVVGVGSIDGEPVHALLEDHQIVERPFHGHTWRFVPGDGPKEELI